MTELSENFLVHLSLIIQFSLTVVFNLESVTGSGFYIADLWASSADLEVQGCE